MSEWKGWDSTTEKQRDEVAPRVETRRTPAIDWNFSSAIFFEFLSLPASAKWLISGHLFHLFGLPPVKKAEQVDKGDKYARR